MIDSTAHCNNNDNNDDDNNKQLLVEKGLQECPASLEKGDIEAGKNIEITPELLTLPVEKEVKQNSVGQAVATGCHHQGTVAERYNPLAQNS